MHDLDARSTRLLPGLLFASALAHAALFALLQPRHELAQTTATALRVDLLATPAQQTAPTPTATPTQPVSRMATASTPLVAEPVVRTVTTRPDPAPTMSPTRAASPNTTEITATTAPTTRIPPSDSAAISTVDKDALRAALIETLQPYFSYPRIGRRLGWQGEVRLQVTIEPHGALSHISLAHSSGNAALDQAALASAVAITGAGAARDLLQGRSFDMVLPVTYRLIDG